MPPLSFFKPNASAGSGDRGVGSISRDSISRPRALSNTGLDNPAYSYAASAADKPPVFLERPSTPPHSLSNAPDGVSLARSASATLMSGTSPGYIHGSPGRYNPARLLRRKASRRGDREDNWGVVPPQNANANTNTATTSSTGLHPGAAPAAIPSTSSNNSAGASTATTPSVTVSPPPRPWGSPPSLTSELMPEGLLPPRQGHVARAQSSSGIPPPPAMSGSTTIPPPPSSNFGSVRSLRSVVADPDSDAGSIHGGMTSLAAAFDPPTSRHGGAGPANHHFLAQVTHQASSAAGSNVTPPSSTEMTDIPSFFTPLSPPRRPARSPAPPPPPRSPQLPQAPAMTSRPRPDSPASASGGKAPLSKDTAEWLARKPSGRRPMPSSSFFTTHAHTNGSNGNVEPNDRSNGVRGVASQSSTHSHTRNGGFSAEPISTSSAFPSRQSFGLTGSGNFGVTDDAPVNSQGASSTTANAITRDSRQIPTAAELALSEHSVVSPVPLSDRPGTPDLVPRRGENYDVSVSCTPGEDEVRWEVVVRRVRGGGYMPPPGPLALAGPTPGQTTSCSRVNAPPLASSVNLSLGLDIDQPTGKLVFIALPDSNSTPTRLRARAAPSPRQPYIYSSRPTPSALPSLATTSGSGTGSGDSSSSGEAGSPPSTLSPVSEMVTAPTTPATPSSPVTADFSLASGLTSATTSPRVRKRRGMHEIFPISTTSVSPPPKPVKDHRRELGSSVSTSPNTPSSSTSAADSPATQSPSPSSAPNVTTSPVSDSANASREQSPPPGATSSIPPVIKAAPPIPSRSHSRRTSSSSVDIPGPTAVTVPPHAPLASVNTSLTGTKRAPPNSRQPTPSLGTLCPVSNTVLTSSGVSLGAMEHIVTPDSIRSASEFEMDLAH